MTDVLISTKSVVGNVLCALCSVYKSSRSSEQLLHVHWNTYISNIKLRVSEVSVLVFIYLIAVLHHIQEYLTYTTVTSFMLGSNWSEPMGNP